MSDRFSRSSSSGGDTDDLPDRTDPTERIEAPARPERDIPGQPDALGDDPGERPMPVESSDDDPDRAPAGDPAWIVRRQTPSAEPHGGSGGGADTGSPDHPRVSQARDQRWFWPLVNLIGLLVVIIVNGLANWLPFNGQTTAEVITRDPIPFQPAGWVFTIWGLIYILLAVFLIYGLLPGGRRNTRLQRISPLFLIANIANITWLFLWHWERFAASMIAMAVLLVSLLAIYIGLRIRNPIRRTATGDQSRILRLITWAPFSVYLGWIIVAALANLMVWLERSGWDGGPFSYTVWAAIFIVGGAAIAAVFAFVAHDVLIPLVAGWAFIGIAQRQWGESALVSVTAIVFAVVAAGLAVMASLLSFDRANGVSVFGRKAVTSPPNSSTTSISGER